MTISALDLPSLREIVGKYGQSHVLRFWDELSPAGQAQLASQLDSINWPGMSAWIQDYVLTPQEFSLPTDLTPAPYFAAQPGNEQDAKLYAQARQVGRDLLSAGKVAGFTVAGGQGTRLGYDAPKGTFCISPVKGKSLFQLFAESIARAQEKYDTIIPWYIMTSPVNDTATRAFFAEQNYFGLDQTNVSFFPQGVMPAIGLDGKLLLGAKDSLSMSPNGHGGSLLALRESGALSDMARRGIEHITYWQVDNPLVQPFDVLFLGLHALTGSEMSCRSLTKTGPFEKLGNFCQSQGRVLIIEYSDMPDDMAQARDTDGELAFRAGSPAIHLLKCNFVERLTATNGLLQMPWHRAVKKVPYIDENGQLQTPAKPNAVKLEMFIFDALPMAQNVLILEAEREEHFGPVKNATGEDSVGTCQALLCQRAARWLTAAGKKVTDSQAVIELSPRRFLDAEDVKNQAEKISSPQPGIKEYYE